MELLGLDALGSARWRLLHHGMKGLLVMLLRLDMLLVGMRLLLVVQRGELLRRHHRGRLHLRVWVLWVLWLRDVVLLLRSGRMRIVVGNWRRCNVLLLRRGLLVVLGICLAANVARLGQGLVELGRMLCLIQDLRPGCTGGTVLVGRTSNLLTGPLDGIKFLGCPFLLHHVDHGQRGKADGSRGSSQTRLYHLRLRVLVQLDLGVV